jgi:hypothetical protein
VGQTGDPSIPERASATVPTPPPSFKPLRRATRPELVVLFTLGPLLWVAAVVAVAYVVHHGEAIGIALLILGGALLVALAVLVPMRIRRVRMERKP